MSLTVPSLPDKSHSNRVRKIVFRSPEKRLRQALALLLNYPSYQKLNREMRACGIADLAATIPELRYKFLGKYLSPVFSVAQRLAILCHCYKFMASQRILPFRAAMAGENVEFWSRIVGENRYDVVLGPVDDAFREGDLALIFRCDGNPLYKLSFSFIPGSVIGLEKETVLFIGGSQGYRGTVSESRRAAKVLGEVCPATLLLLVLKAVTKALGLYSIVGVSLEHHSCDVLSTGKIQPLLAYDDFWQANGAKKNGYFYHMTSELAFRPSEAASSAHRARARRKQERKMGLYAEMLAKFGISQSQEFAPARPDWKAAALVAA